VALLSDASSAFIQVPSDGPSTSLPAVVRHEAARALGRVATTAPPELMELLAEDDEATAAYASIALGRIGAPAAQPVAERLRETDLKVRRRALSALYAMGPKAGAAVPALVQSLSDPDEEFRKSVLATLSAIGPPAESAMPTLVSKLGGSPSARELQATTRAIGDIGQPREKAVAALIGCLSSGDPVTRDIACEVLGNLGDGAAIPALRQRLEDEADWVRLSAADALMRLGQRDVGQPVVLDWLRTKDRLLQDAARALAEAGDDSDEVVSVLTDLLRDGDPFVRDIAAGGLWRRGMTAHSAIPALLACLEDEDAQTRAAAAAALARMGRRSEALPVLMACLDCNNEMGRRTAIEAVGRLKETSAIPRLRALAFREADDRMVDAVDKTLAAMGEGGG
jgi:HEAT repeat protein